MLLCVDFEIEMKIEVEEDEGIDGSRVRSVNADM